MEVKYVKTDKRKVRLTAPFYVHGVSTGRARAFLGVHASGGPSGLCPGTGAKNPESGGLRACSIRGFLFSETSKLRTT